MTARLATFAAASLLVLAACSSTQNNSTQSRSSAPVEATTPAPDPLPLTSHVVTELTGFTSNGTPTHQTVKAFAKAHHKTVAQLHAIGVVGGVTVKFQPAAKLPGNALSVAEEFGSADAATIEADRLFAANAEPDPGAKAAPLAVPGIPGVQAVQITGKFQGHRFTSVEIVFVQETVVHELFAIGAGPLVSVPDLVAAATAMFIAIDGHPLQ